MRTCSVHLKCMLPHKLILYVFVHIYTVRFGKSILLCFLFWICCKKTGDTAVFPCLPYLMWTCHAWWQIQIWACCLELQNAMPTHKILLSPVASFDTTLTILFLFIGTTDAVPMHGCLQWHVTHPSLQNVTNSSSWQGFQVTVRRRHPHHPSPCNDIPAANLAQRNS